jgi:hypothetical protein
MTTPFRDPRDARIEQLERENQALRQSRANRRPINMGVVEFCVVVGIAAVAGAAAIVHVNNLNRQIDALDRATLAIETDHQARIDERIRTIEYRNRIDAAARRYEEQTIDSQDRPAITCVYAPAGTQAPSQCEVNFPGASIHILCTEHECHHLEQP